MCWWLVPNAAFAQRYIPDCAGRPEISQTRVVRVERNGDLILPDGRAVMLEGIRLPDAPHRMAALSMLRGLASKGPLTFAVTEPKLDRYGRVRAQGFGEIWLQTALLERGLALASVSSDRNECFPEFYDAEALARKARAGIWADTAYQPRASRAVKQIGAFQLVEGRVASVGRQDGWIILSFDGPRGVSAAISTDDRRAFRDFDLEGLETRHIRIRGLVQGARSGPRIALTNPAQIEMLD